jgi:small-conductance mechanosensitive channel
MKQESMKQESVHSSKNKIFLLMIFFVFAMGIIVIGIEQPLELIMANKKIVNWISWIILYFIAQFAVAVFIGRAIKGSNKSE